MLVKVTIQAFLLARVSEHEAEYDAKTHPKRRGQENGFEGDRMRILRHADRTMVVTWRNGSETIERCGICPKASDPPCPPLRRMAQLYAGHLDYDPAWALPVA